MSGRIPQAFIDELLGNADIAEVVGSRVALKKAGSILKGLCPFHAEKTPSFTVSPTRGTYHCFGCGQHGSAIGFLMAYDNLSYPEAIEALAELLGPTNAAASTTSSTRCYARRIRSIAPRCARARRRSRT